MKHYPLLKGNIVKLFETIEEQTAYWSGFERATERSTAVVWFGRSLWPIVVTFVVLVITIIITSIVK